MALSLIGDLRTECLGITVIAIGNTIYTANGEIYRGTNHSGIDDGIIVITVDKSTFASIRGEAVLVVICTHRWLTALSGIVDRDTCAQCLTFVRIGIAIHSTDRFIDFETGHIRVYAGVLVVTIDRSAITPIR
jgi:hypothetical protein